MVITFQISEVFSEQIICLLFIYNDVDFFHPPKDPTIVNQISINYFQRDYNLLSLVFRRFKYFSEVENAILYQQLLQKSLR